MNPLAKVNKSASSCRLEVLQGALQIRLEQVENILIVIKLEKWPFTLTMKGQIIGSSTNKKYKQIFDSDILDSKI